MLSVQMRCGARCDEELAAVGAGAGIGHAQLPSFSVTNLEILICKLFTIDGFASGAVSPREVPALDHEVGDHSVEGRALVVQRLARGGRLCALPRAQGPEILTSARSDGGVQLHHHTTSRLVADSDVEEDLAAQHSTARRSTARRSSANDIVV